MWNRCGTGISSFIWKDYSDKVIGIDPNIDMLSKAKEKCDESDVSNIFFQFGFGNETNLEPNCADIITCSSAFQWMEPQSTIKEISRVLIDAGVFAMYNHDQPPTTDWVIEKAYRSLFQNIYRILDNTREDEGRVKLWTINEYLDTMKKSNEF
ncbi:class I SAM-dependent methyltransferase [Brassicibacter mesophilus]|uniref:class I SAM-dependent methyltransferase n=1 Tax=Brassicibacter mesophilus TaxID=745119 RepID=UPI003D1EF7F2